VPKNKARYQNSPSGYPRNDRFAPILLKNSPVEAE